MKHPQCPHCGTIDIQVVKHSLERLQFRCRKCSAASPVFHQDDRNNILLWSAPEEVQILVRGGVVDALNIPEHIKVRVFDFDVTEDEASDKSPEGEPCVAFTL